MKKSFSALIAGLIFVLILTGCTITITPSNPSPSNSSHTGQTNSQLHWGVQTKTAGCKVNGPLPDSACTPGAIFPNATKQDICQSGYAKSVRDVSTSTKNQVYAEYSITHRSTGEYEVDHFISLELGGSNDSANLWPEAASPTPGFHQKDQVENYLHNQVCSGVISLKDAQTEISTNWLNVYSRMPKS